MKPVVKTIFLALTSALFSISATAQTLYTGKEAARKYVGTDMVRTGKFSETPTYLRFAKGNELGVGEWKQWLTEKLGLSFDYDFKLVKADTDKLGHVHYRMLQTKNGIALENAMWIVHTNAGKVYSMNGLLFTQITAPVTATITEAAALNAAVKHIGAVEYKWQMAEEEAHLKIEQKDENATYFPKGELVYGSETGKLKDSDNKLVYKFNIYAHNPVGRYEVLVDATTGNIIAKRQLLHDADVLGTAHTKYSGVQPMTADSFGGSFRLRETGRGDGIETYNMQQGTSYGGSVDFTDADNVWNNINAQEDEVATDAHWGAEMTYDYFLGDHNRNSIDNAGFNLLSYVHYDVAYVNAFWDGQRMTYGDGSGSYNPFTALDITGHEISHGLTEFTADLVYQDESGALNESFSDIFGTCIEFYGKPGLANWFMGENIGVTLRNMANPAQYGDPDTYFGNNWAPLGGADNGGVHTNSGVQNFWFYLLSQGGSGTNDNGDAYNVTGLGMDNAADIAFRNLTVYLSNNSQYSDARFFAVQSAIDLFGGCTPEVEATTNAWYAVGVGPAYVAEVIADFVPSTTGGCTNPLTVNFDNSSFNGISYTWDFGDGNTSTLEDASHTYTNNGVYDVTLIADGGLCGIDTLEVTSQIFVGQLPDPIVSDGGRCDAGTVTLSATGSGQLSWYTVPVGGLPIATGNTYTTPSIGTTTTYYVDGVTGAGLQYVGPVNNGIGTGGYTTSDRWLIFDALQPFTLNSVWVFANGAGNRTIELRNSAGTVLQSATINIPNGGSTVTLNFSVPAGTNLQLGTVAGTPSTLYRSSGGVNYPYDIAGVVSIHNSNSGGSWYYYFYNWEIQATVCQSARVPVVAGISSAPVTTDNARCGPGNVTLSATGTTGTLHWYDAPAAGNLVNTGPTYNAPVTSTTTYYVEEEMPGSPEYVGAPDNTFGGGGYFSGDQHLVFDVTSNCILKSVLVYANGAGNRTVQLRNSTGAVLQSAVINIPNGQNRITLNFPLTPGTNYQLGWANGSAPDLYRNNSGTPAYPYSLAGGEVVITTSSPGNGYYYAYYDWEIELPGCITPRTPVTATVNAAFNASINSAGPYCSSASPVILTSVDAGGTWTGTGITNGTTGEFDPIAAGVGTHAITYTIAGTCGDIDTQNVVVTNTFDATIAATSTMCTGGGIINLTAVDPGGTWTGTGITNGTTGAFDPATAGTGTHTITYTIAGACGAFDTEDVAVATSMDATITSVGTLCETASAVTLTAVDGGGTWSGTGVSGTSFDAASAGNGTHTVTYTIPGVCGDTDTEIIDVDPVPDATIIPGGTYCMGVTTVPMAAVNPGGTWSSDCGSCVNMISGLFYIAFAGVGTHNIMYTITNGCGSDVDTIQVSVQDCSGITEIEQTFNVHLFPNPADEYVQLVIENSTGKTAAVEIRNNLGQMVFTKHEKLNGAPLVISTQSFSTGVYYVNVRVENNMLTSKLVVR